MYLVLFTAIAVGGATIIGAVAGLLLGNTTPRMGNNILAFAAGIMLAASVLGLILPALETGGRLVYPITVVGIFSGAFLIYYLDRFLGGDSPVTASPCGPSHGNNSLLFVIAIAIHNLPEGLAAGVGFGAGNTADALIIAGGIALQNIPEGMVIISPMIASGIKKGKAFVYAALTGVIEIIGTLSGYFFITVSASLLPFVLAFAGGTMLFVISDDIIPSTHSEGSERAATFALLIGFCLMLATDHYLG